ncbi:hypothetical protein SETIT_3G212200v2 [Setaria italica]|uniref:Uncharacterized protein n=1 Tax=Setaria italica TaxID=4555 RepID=A0A368QH80_SETIT|nr:hypothetical protein SETIT_3G212200v2 [Setaria italica]
MISADISFSERFQIYLSSPPQVQFSLLPRLILPSHNVKAVSEMETVRSISQTIEEAHVFAKKKKEEEVHVYDFHLMQDERGSSTVCGTSSARGEARVPS